MTDEATKIKAVVARGKQRFFERNPQLLEDLEAKIAQDSGAGGTDKIQQLEVEKYRTIAAAAKTLKKDSLVMLLELGSDSTEELEELIAAQNREIKKTIGL
jgi:ferritin-like metal-binding protein YciE